MQADRRILFFGDSFVAGVGDPTGLGWVGRVVAASHAAGAPLTAYNLGVRRDASADVLARFHEEARARTRVSEATYGVVLGLGVNDAAAEDGAVRVEPGTALGTLGRLIDAAGQIGRGAFVVGPPPAGEAAHDARVCELSARMARLAAGRGVPFVETAAPLLAQADWRREAAAGDGTHPGARGYAALAELVLAGGWLDWLR